MLIPRLIPALLLRNKGLFKTIRFKNPKYVGDPINVIRIFNDKEVDELMLLDIDASREQREPDYDLLEQIAGECFMPLAYGGGISAVSQAKRLFALGIEKICIQTSCIDNPKFIKRLVSEFGSQSIIASIDIKRNWRGDPRIYKSASRRMLSLPWLDLLSQLVEAGVGEILLNSVDKDGTLSGPDLTLIQEASARINVPLISLGGVSCLTDIKESLDYGASAVAAGSFFVYHGPHRAVLITYPNQQSLIKLFS